MIFSTITAIATSIGGLLTSTFLSGGLGTLLLKAAVGIGINLAAQAIAGQPEGPSFAVQGKLQSGGDVPRSFPLGYTATAGSLVYANTWGKAGKTPNAYLTQVIALSDLPIGGLVELWVNGEKVTLPDFTQPPISNAGWNIVEYEKDGGDNNLWIKFYDGTQTVADPYLVNEVSSAERPYESTRVGHGVAYAIITSQVKEDLFTGFPSFKFAVNGAKLYDLSKDSTAGGSGTHRWSDPSTWGGDGDHLPAVQMYNLGRGITYAGQWFYGLQGVTAARLPAAHWIGQIQKCRAPITSGGATVPTYRSGGEVAVSAQLGDAFQGLLTTCQARLSEAGGVYKLFVGAPGALVANIDDGVIISTDEQSFTPFFGLADTINGITAKHPNPAEGWNVKVAPPIYRADLEVLSGNRRLLADVSFDFVPYADQVQRLMKSAIEEAQRARRHTFVLPPEYWVLEPGDVISWTSERNGYVTKLFRVDGVIDRANLDVMVDLTEVDPADFDWNDGTDYRVPVDGPVGPNRPVPQPIIDWSATASSITDSTGMQRRPAILLAWDGDQRDVEAVAFEVRKASNLAVDYRGRTDNPEAGAILISQNLLPLTEYQVRGRYLPRSDRETLWSDWLAVTTLELLINSVDIFDNAIIRNKIADAAIDAAKLENEAVTELKLAAEAVSTAKLQVGAVTEAILASGAVSAAKIQDAALTISKFASGIRPVEILGALPATGNFAGRMVFLTTDGKLYRHAGSPSGAAGFTAATAAGDLVGEITSTQISDGAISTPKLAAGAVVANSIATNAVTSDKIVAGSIVAGKIAAGAVSATEIASQSIIASKLFLQDYSNIYPDYDMVDPAFYSGTATGYSFVASASGQTGLNFLAVPNTPATQTYVTTGYIPIEDTVEHFAKGTIWNLSGGNVTLVFQTFSVDAAGALTLLNSYTVGNTTNTAMTDVAVNIPAVAGARRGRFVVYNNVPSTNAVRAAALVLRRKSTAELIVDGSIIADKLATNSVTTAKIAAGSVTATEIATNAITAVKIQAGSITGAKIAAGTITGDKLVASTITAREMILTDYTNLAIEPAFEAAGAAWNLGANGTIVDNNVSAGTSYTGRYSLAVTGTNAIAAGNSNFVKVAPGDQFLLAAYTKNVGASGNIQVRVRFTNAAGSLVSTSTMTFPSSQPGSDYVRQSMNIDVPDPTSAVFAQVDVNLPATITGTWRVGYVGLFRRANAELIVDGAITAGKIAANSITAGMIAAGAITANKIA
ncbi:MULTISPECIES: phage tail protein, partial [unclassified Mesorhizobium]|uniref:phage tail protein n=1 Tax=unclassified Mesorhizobium TaxID=325217 RepID=UPI0030144A05